MARVDDALATMIRNLEPNWGRSHEMRVKPVRKQMHAQVVAWPESEHALARPSTATRMRRGLLGRLKPAHGAAS